MYTVEPFIRTIYMIHTYMYDSVYYIIIYKQGVES